MLGLLFYGRLEKEKGFDKLFNALKSVDFQTLGNQTIQIFITKKE